MVREKYETERRAEHAEVFGIVDALVEQVERYLLAMEIKSDDGLNIVNASLLLRLATGLEAASILASRGYYTEAASQVRGLMEAMVRLAALCKQPSLLDVYIMQDKLNRERILEDTLDFRKSWSADVPRNPPDEQITLELDKVKQAIGEYNARAEEALRAIKVFEWAKIGGVEHLIFGHYPILSQAVHHAPRDLERRFVVEQGDLCGIIVGPELGDIPYLLFVACRFVFVGFQWFNTSNGLQVPEGVDALYRKYEDAFARFAEEGREGSVPAP